MVKIILIWKTNRLEYYSYKQKQIIVKRDKYYYFIHSIAFLLYFKNIESLQFYHLKGSKYIVYFDYENLHRPSQFFKCSIMYIFNLIKAKFQN